MGVVDDVVDWAIERLQKIVETDHHAEVLQVENKIIRKTKDTCKSYKSKLLI